MIGNPLKNSVNLKDYEQFDTVLRKLDTNLLSFDHY